MRQVFSVIGQRGRWIVNYERRKTHKSSPIFALALCPKTLSSWLRLLKANLLLNNNNKKAKVRVRSG